MTQKTELVITANATQATAALADVKRQLGGVENSAVSVDRAIVNLEKEMIDLSTAITRGGSNVDAYKESLRRAERELDRISGVAATTSQRFGAIGSAAGIAGPKTRNLGQAALEGSRAMEDLQYGIGGVVNNIPGLVMAMGGPAGLVAVISLAAVAAAQLYKNWDSVSAAFGSSAADFKVAKGALQDLADAFDIDLNKRMSEGRQTLKDLKDELRDFGQDARSKDLGKQERDITDMERRLENLQETRRFRQAAFNDAESKRDSVRLADAKMILEETDRRAKALESSLKEARQTFWETANTSAELAGKEAARDRAEDARRKAEAAARKKERLDDKTTVTGGNDGIATGWEEADQKAREKANEAAINAQLKRDERIAANEEMFRNMTYEQEKAAYQRREQLAENHANMIAGITISTAGILADGIASAALGQEDAVEQTLAALSRQAGGFITLKGGELLASGIAGTLMLPGNPKSLAELAGGAALVAAGAAVTAGGPAAVSSLMGGGGSSGSTGGGSGSRDTGASPSRGGGSGSGGPLIINVSYGAGGPLPEDVGREIARAVGGSNRRRGAA